MKNALRAVSYTHLDVYKRQALELSNLILYTTRPMREGEKQGREYHFVKEEQFFQLKEAGRCV